MNKIRVAAVLWTMASAIGALSQGIESHSRENGAIFSIGKFDRSSQEFVPGTAPGAVDFIVGKSQPSRDWYAVQLAASTESVDHDPDSTGRSRTITFSLNQAPAADYRMHIAVITGYSLEPTGLPILSVEINGKRGRFFLHPQLDYSNGDFGDFFNPSYSHADVIFGFPGSYLHQGKNKITLDVVQVSDKTVQNAGITYDAIDLAVGSENLVSPPLVNPTIFYLPDPVREIVEVYLRYSSPFHPGTPVSLRVAGKRFSQVIPFGEDFGEAKLEFPLPEFSPGTGADLEWSEGGHSRQTHFLMSPQKKWTLFLVPHIHLDVGYSDYQAKVASLQSLVFDQAMDMTDAHPEYRFTTDAEWSVEQFLNTHSEGDKQRLIDAIRKQQIFVPAVYAQLHTGTPTAETLIRSLYPSANFSRLHGTPFNYANSTDVPSYSWSYASILKSAGIDYFLAGSDNIRAPVLLQGKLNENSPFWWPGPDGKKVLLWYSRHYMQMQLLFGLPPSIEAGSQSLPSFLQQYERTNYVADAVILFGAQQENRALFPQQAELAERWNHTYLYPKLQYSGVYDAMKAIEQEFGAKIPTICCDGGPYWEEGTATDAYYAAMERENESRAPSAEKLATLTSVVNPRLVPDKQVLNRMWNDMVLMDEHTWASDNSEIDPLSEESKQQTSMKEQFAVDARSSSDFVARDSMASIVDSIATRTGDIVVFNMLNWSRNGPVFLDLAHNREIVDSVTGKTVPFEVISKSNNLDRIRFIAEDVPGMGYKIFGTRDASASPPSSGGGATNGSQAGFPSNVVESPYYRVTLDPATGAIRSVYDKELNRELANAHSPYKFGQYLYVSGGDASSNTILTPSNSGPKPELAIHPSANGRLISTLRTPEGWVARLISSSMNTPSIETEVRLFDHEKKIQITEEIEKRKVFQKEAAYIAFPLEMDHPQFQYEIQTGVVDPAKDLYPGAGHEWFPVQHWVAAQQNDLSVAIMPLDASLVTLGDINRGAWPSSFGQREGTIFSYIMNNYWFTNFPAGQGGKFSFRYIISSASRTDAGKLSRAGWEEMTPLERNESLYQDKSSSEPVPLQKNTDSLLALNDPELLLGTWKQAEDGEGSILRFYDLGGETRSVTVRIPLEDIQQAFETDAVERDQESLQLRDQHSFSFTVHPHEIITVRIKGNSVVHPARYGASNDR